MIQRLQSVYLVAIILIAIMVSTGSLLSGIESTAGLVKQYDLSLIYFKVYENGVQVTSEIQYGLILILALVIGWTLNVLLAYKNRSKQIKLAKWNFLFMIMLIVALFAKAILYIPGFTFSTQNMQSVFGVALLIFMMYLNMRALLLIKRDEELVKSADRIR